MKTKTLLLAITSILCVLSGPAFSAEIVAGPVLQFPGDTTMTIVWETDEQIEGEVLYDESEEKVFVVRSGYPATHHIVRLTNLRPDTKYAYHIAEGDEILYDSYFTTLPRDGSYRVVIIGDTHVPKKGFSKLVPIIESLSPDLIIFLGDMVTDGGDRDQWLEFFHTGKTLFDHIPIAAVVGNHDLDKEDRGALYEYFFRQPNGATSAPFSYTATISADRFVFLDVETNKILSMKWFLGTLLDSVTNHDDRRLFVLSHEGITSFKGNRTGCFELRQFHMLMKLCGVTALFSGHDHHYVRGRTYLGLPFFISGGGGGASYAVNKKNISSKLVGYMEFSYIGDHFLMMEVSDTNCIIKACNERGEVFDEIDLYSDP